MSETTNVRRWVVRRPGPDGKPLGVLKVEVVPAEAYDRLKDEVIGDVADLLRGLRMDDLGFLDGLFMGDTGKAFASFIEEAHREGRL